MEVPAPHKCFGTNFIAGFSLKVGIEVPFPLLGIFRPISNKETGLQGFPKTVGIFLGIFFSVLQFLGFTAESKVLITYPFHIMIAYLLGI